MPPVVFLAVFVALAGLGVVVGRRSRARGLAQIRADWGRPVSRTRDLGAIAASHQSRSTHWEPAGSMDARTWRDLDLDAVFVALDRTQSTLGQHALYDRMRRAPAASASALDEFEALVSRVGGDASLRERAQLGLSRLRDPHGYDLWWLARPDAIETRPWYVLFPVLTAASVLLLVLTLLWPLLTPALIGVLLLNVGVRYATDHHIGAISTAFRQIAPLVTAAEVLRDLGGEASDTLVGAIRRDTPSLRRLKSIARWISGDPLMLPVAPGPWAVVVNDVVSVLYEYVNLVLLLDGNGVYFGVRDLRAHHRALLRVVAAVGDVDAALSTASFRAGRHDWTRPTFRPAGGPATLVDIRHPLLDDAVPNSIVLSAGRGVLVTGSNMSGKSTFLRTVGVTTIMAQTLNTCLATTYDAPLFQVRSCIGRSDDLSSGRSYYVAEVEALLDLVRASAGSEPHLFLLDELFRGTNTVERIAAGHAVLLELVSRSHRESPHVVLAATHDGELIDWADDYAAFHFGDAIGPEGLRFDHRLRAGPATTRNAIALLRLHGAPDALVRRAVACAAHLDAQRGPGHA